MRLHPHPASFSGVTVWHRQDMLPVPAKKRSGLNAWIHTISILVPLVFLALSPMALSAIGWNYDSLGGSALERFHPASLLILLLILLIALRNGNPLAGILDLLSRDLMMSLFLIVWCFMLVHAATNQARPSAPLIDTFLIPALIVLALREIEDETRARMMRVVHVMLLINALVGIGEFATGLRLTPYVAGGVHITDDWRSTALLGHPLGNALMTGCYTMLLMLGGGGLKSSTRLAMIGLQFLAMVAFGGRASLVLLVLFGAGAALRAIFLFLGGQRLKLTHLTILASVFPLIAIGTFILVDLGFFDKFILRFVEDKGSAEARIIMFELFNGFTLQDILLGPQQDHLNYKVLVYSLEFGIESVWISFALYYGILPSAVFFIGFVFFCLSLLNDCKWRASLGLGYFMLVNTTFLGIGGKTPILTTLSMTMVLMLPRRRHAHQVSRPLAYPVETTHHNDGVFPRNNARC